MSEFILEGPGRCCAQNFYTEISWLLAKRVTEMRRLMHYNKPKYRILWSRCRFPLTGLQGQPTGRHSWKREPKIQIIASRKYDLDFKDVSNGYFQDKIRLGVNNDAKLWRLWIKAFQDVKDLFSSRCFYSFHMVTLNSVLLPGHIDLPDSLVRSTCSREQRPSDHLVW